MDESDCWKLDKTGEPMDNENCNTPTELGIDNLVIEKIGPLHCMKV